MLITFMMKELLSTKKKIVISPHYDDLILSLGGLVSKWSKINCQIEEWIVFSNSNYLVNDNKGNKDISKERIKVVSSIRLKEELRATKNIKNIKLKLCHQDEALIRNHNEKEHKRGFPHGFDEKKDKKVLENLRKLLLPLFSKDVQIFVPLAIQEHIDHFIIRKAAISILNSNKKAQVFFYEDLPYVAYTSKGEWKHIKTFIIQHKLLPIIVPIDLNFKLKLLDYYNSQTDKYYYEGVSKRAKEIQKEQDKKLPCEKIYLLS